MKKTVYALFLLMICFFSFCMPAFGVSAEVVDHMQENAFRIARKGYLDGKISLTYIFPLNSKLLKNEGFSQEEIDVYKFYLTTYVNALAKSNAENLCEGVTIENSKYFTDVDGIGFSILFENLDVQKRFFGTSSSESDSKSEQRKSGFFISKTELTTTFPVSSSKSAGDLKMICLMAVSSWANNNSLSKERSELASSNYQSSNFIYDFALQERGLKSKVMYQDENFYHNVFVKSLSDIESDNHITFWVTSINTPVWYIGAVIVVVLGMSASWGCYKFSQKRKNSKKI